MNRLLFLTTAFFVSFVLSEEDSDNLPKTTTDEVELETSTYTNECNYDEIRFEYQTTTLEDGDEIDYETDCYICVCISYENDDNVEVREEKCNLATSEQFWNKVKSECDLDGCDYDNAVWSDDTCSCPECDEDIDDDDDDDDGNNNNGDSDSDDTNDQDDDDLYDDGKREYWPQKYNDSYC